MKKLLLTAAVVAISTSAVADDAMFYARVDGGASFLPKLSYDGQKGKMTNHFVADLGVGTYLMDNVRTEFLLSNHFSAKQNYKAGGGYNEKTKYTAMSLTLKGLVDFWDFEVGKAFAGVGLGYTQLGAKATGSTVNAAGSTITYKSKAKKTGNVSYLLTAGAGFTLSEGVMLDIAYAFNDYGSTKSLKTIYADLSTSTDKKVHLRSHDITAGVRFEL